MRKRILFLVAVLLTLLFLVSQFFAKNRAEITKIQTQIETLEQDLNELENFSKEFQTKLEAKEVPREVIYNMFLFDTKYIDLRFKTTVTKGVLNRIISKNIPRDPLIELQMQMISLNKQTPMQFVREMLLTIRSGIDLLEKEKEELQKFIKS